MSRVVLLSMTESEVLAQCHASNIGVSTIERLNGSGVRLVCMSSTGADQIRKKLKSSLIEGEVVREKIRPRHSSW